MLNFRKNGDCPASHQVLSFQKGELCAEAMLETASHLSKCEFCLAELEFYSHYPQRDEWVIPEPIPAPLYDLAVSLLRKGRDGFRWLDSMLHISSQKNN